MEAVTERPRIGGGVSSPEGATERLAPRELMALQLAAIGYSAAQVNYLFARTFGPGTSGYELLERAVRALDAVGIPGAIAEARRRGLIQAR